MNWESIEQIVSYFQLTIDDSDPIEVKKAIKMKMADIHPDKNNQQFKSESDEELWRNLNSAKLYLDKCNQSRTALIPVSQLPALIKSIQQSNLPPIENRISDLRQESRSDNHSKNMLPRISSGVFATICGFLFTFSSSLKDHPFLGNFISMRETQIALLIAMVYSGVFFVMTWMRERRQEVKLDWLVTNEGIRATIKLLLAKLSHEQHCKNLHRFTLRDLTKVLHVCDVSEYRRELSIQRLFEEFPFLGGACLSNSIAEKVARLQIEALKERGILFEVPKKGFEIVYELSGEASKELMNEFMA